MFNIKFSLTCTSFTILNNFVVLYDVLNNVNKQVGLFAVSCHCQTVSVCTTMSYVSTYLLLDKLSRRVPANSSPIYKSEIIIGRSLRPM